MTTAFRALAALALLAAAWASPALACETEPGMKVAPFNGQTAAGRDLQLTGDPYRLILAAEPLGWRFEVRGPGGEAQALVFPPSRPPRPTPALTGPQFRPGPAPPVDIVFHFGAEARDPVRHPELTITPAAPGAPRGGGDAFGRVDLRLLDFELAAAAPDEPPRMVRAVVEGCLHWKQTPAPTFEFTPDETRELARCGLDLRRYRPSVRFAPRLLRPDLDGDGAPDLIAQVVAGEARGLALCLGGRRTLLIGFGQDPAGLSLEPGFIASLETWSIAPPGTTSLGYQNEPPWPKADGQIVLLERLEKAAILLFMQGGRLRAQTMFRYVEP